MGEAMNERASEFLDRWLAEHVAAVPDAQRLQETVRLVALCREDALRLGISSLELRTAAGGDMIRNMLAALGSAAPRGNEATVVADAT